MKKPSEKEIFQLAGPVHLTCVDWKNPEHRRSVAASLVNGVYIHERDRQGERSGHNAAASNWWETFHFQLIKTLEDQKDSSIFGAIFEYKPHSNYPMALHDASPRYVIAFRGTIMKPETICRDFYLDAKLTFNRLADSSRYRTALEEVQRIINQAGGHASVWLAGHSLGAAIALQAGRDMAKMGCYIESYLFNPPYASVPVEMLKDPLAKDLIRVGNSFATAGLSILTKALGKNPSSQQCDPFTILSSWTPYLFVNQMDTISREYIAYFEHRERMEQWGLGAIERIAAKTSMVGLLAGALGTDGEVPRLIPSAYLTKNMVNIKQGLEVAHGIHQWWKPHPHWESKLYQMK